MAARTAFLFFAIVALSALGVLLFLGAQRQARRRTERVSRELGIPTPEEPAGSAPSPPAPRLTAPPSTSPEVPEVGVAAPRPRLRDRLGRARAAFGGALAGLRGHRVDDATWEEVEEALLLADVGVATTGVLVDRLREQAAAARVTEPAALIDLLRDDIVERLQGSESRALALERGEPNVWLFVGVNGVGKTTTIAKLAAQARADGHDVLLAAADTFRAAAAEQLEHWGDEIGVEVVRGQEGADPGSVVFDAMSAASNRGADLLLVDTAGRLHTKVNLMEELKKLRRIVDRTPGSCKEVLLVVDATTGQNGLAQAREFAQAVDVTGVVLTKLDGTAKGGIVLAIEAELGIPVKVVGVGEDTTDLVPFDPEEFVAAIFDGEAAP